MQEVTRKAYCPHTSLKHSYKLDQNFLLRLLDRRGLKSKFREYDYLEDRDYPLYATAIYGRCHKEHANEEKKNS